MIIYCFGLRSNLLPLIVEHKTLRCTVARDKRTCEALAVEEGWSVMQSLWKAHRLLLERVS